MSFRIALALSLSVILVGVASWDRFIGVEKSNPTISIVENTNTEAQDKYYQELMKGYTETSTSTATKKLTGTDLIGRQMIIDYVDLSTSGQASSDNINALAERYVESIPTLNNARKASILDIKVVSNSKTSFQNYSNEISSIQSQYAKDTDNLYNKNPNINELGKAYYGFSSSMSTIYNELANKLMETPVPGSLVQKHLELINIYLSNASAVEAMSKTEEDPATSFAGIIALKENTNREGLVLNEILKILTENNV